MRGIIFTGGLMPNCGDIRRWIDPFDFVIAADSGLEGLERAGIAPDLIVGDMDSLSDPRSLDRYTPDRVRAYPRDKDYSDTELALREMEARSITDIAIVGGDGGRMDHFFALRSIFDGDLVPSLWLGTVSAVIAVGIGTASRSVRVEGLRADDPVSIFPAGEKKHRCHGCEFHWPVDGLAWDAGDFSLSNRANDGRVVLRADEGRFLLIVPFNSLVTVFRDA